MPHVPALDGVRAFAVVAVLLFHGGAGWLSGGYLGVSVFFTLSGFLITNVVLDEHRRTGRIDLGAFLARRLRRLLPASLVCLTGVVVAARLGAFPGVTGLRGDVIAALAQVHNWWALLGGGSYADLLDATVGVASPVDHAWSLSIEQQFYWIWPVVLLVLARRAVRAPVLVLTAASAAAAPLIAWRWGPDAAYWATPARAAELLIGASLAVVLASPAGAVGATGWRHVGSSTRLGLLAPAALAALIAAMVTFPAGSGPAYAGALPLVGVASGALVLGLLHGGPITWLMSTPPLVLLGRISYGVYLYHWPLFLALDTTRTGVDGPALFALRCAATLAVSAASYRWIERPILRARPATWRPVSAAAIGTSVAVALAAMVLVPTGDREFWRIDEGDLAAVTPAPVHDTVVPAVRTPATSPPRSPTGTVPRGTPAPTPDAPEPDDAEPDDTDPAVPEPALATPDLLPPSVADVAPQRPVRVLVAGDSTAVALGGGLVAHARDRPDVLQVALEAADGCGFLATGEYLVGSRWTPVPEGCSTLVHSSLPDAVADVRPDAVVLMVTGWDVSTRRWSDGVPLVPSDADYASRLTEAYHDLTQSLLDAGAGTVLWVRQPVPDSFWLGQRPLQDQPEQHAVMHRAMADVVDRFPGRTGVLDLEGWMRAELLAADQEVRPDGIHLGPDASSDIADRFVVPWLLASAWRSR